LEVRRRTAVVLTHFEIVEHLEDAVDVSVLVVEAVQGAGEAYRVARIAAFVELLAAGEGRDRGVRRRDGTA
jgi:hypothetical protein